MQENTVLMRQDELISVIVPVYNVEKYLEICVNSIRSQTYSNLEIILVDDGSPDNSGAICDRLAAEDNRIRVIHKQNEGLGLTRNAGIKAASGQWIMFIDSDDWIDTTMAADLLKAVQRNDADMAICGKKRIYPNGRKEWLPSCQNEEVYIGKEEILENVFFPLLGNDLENLNRRKRNAVAVWINIYKAELLKKTELQFQSERICLSEDILFNLNYSLLCKRIVRIPGCQYNYRYNPVSLSSTFRKNRIWQTQNLYRDMEEIVESEGLRTRAGWRMERSYMMDLRHSLMQACKAALSWQEKMEYYQEAIAGELTQIIAAEYPHKGIPMRERLMVTLIRRKKTVMLYCYMALQRNMVNLRNQVRG